MIKRLQPGILTLLAISIISSSSLQAQSQDHVKVRPVQFYLGIQPSVNVEPINEYQNTITFNVVPLIVEYAVNNRWSIRLNPIVNLQLRPEFPSAISHIGLGVTVPYHFSKKNSEEGQRGFYAGPNLAISKHILDGFNTTTLAAEVGYAFIFNRVLSITVGAQVGSSISVSPDTGFTTIRSHSEAIFSFGFWF
ncbi:MAG: hypothetical protein U9N86_01610 [Bacteroidota bacterium]|nr:hypothetical protein [Bacteroidota bacterium]